MAFRPKNCSTMSPVSPVPGRLDCCRTFTYFRNSNHDMNEQIYSVYSLFSCFYSFKYAQVMINHDKMWHNLLISHDTKNTLATNSKDTVLYE